MSFDLFFEREESIVKQKIDHLNPQGIHNFCYGTLDCYFRIEKLATKGKVAFLLNGKAIALTGMPGKFSKKLYVYDNDVPTDELNELHKDFLIYSIDRLPLSNEKPFDEVFYEFSTVFNPASYANSKKRYQRLKYPFKFAKENDVIIEEVHSSDISKCDQLHDQWVEHKLEDPKTFRMMFPNARYKNCLHIAMENSTNDYRTFKVLYKSEIVGVRVVYVYNNQGYDLAFFSNFWSTPSQLTTYTNVIIMKDLYSNGVATLNCGAGLNKFLHTAKAHYACSSVRSYMYSKE